MSAHSLILLLTCGTTTNEATHDVGSSTLSMIAGSINDFNLASTLLRLA